MSRAPLPAASSVDVPLCGPSLPLPNNPFTQPLGQAMTSQSLQQASAAAAAAAAAGVLGPPLSRLPAVSFTQAGLQLGSGGPNPYATRPAAVGIPPAATAEAIIRAPTSMPALGYSPAATPAGYAARPTGMHNPMLTGQFSGPSASSPPQALGALSRAPPEVLATAQQGLQALLAAAGGGGSDEGQRRPLRPAIGGLTALPREGRGGGRLCRSARSYAPLSQQRDALPAAELAAGSPDKEGWEGGARQPTDDELPPSKVAKADPAAAAHAPAGRNASKSTSGESED